MVTEAEFKDIAEIVEVHMNVANSGYSASIGMGYASCRFNGAYKKYLSTFVEQGLYGGDLKSPQSQK